jgi:hypothetical protein
VIARPTEPDEGDPMTDDAGAEPATTPPATTPPTTPDDERTGTAGQVAESAAEIALGAVIGPFTGGETVTMVESIKETVEEGVDRLTHRGHRREPAPEAVSPGNADEERLGPPPETGDDPAGDDRD